MHRISVGVIHRDLKPQNVMQEEGGRILVMDFGLARTMKGDGMTQTGALVGTMEYMSPEQALGKELDQRSDIFTAGLILYELLTGQMPSRRKVSWPASSSARRSAQFRLPNIQHDSGRSERHCQQMHGARSNLCVIRAPRNCCSTWTLGGQACGGDAGLPCGRQALGADDSVASSWRCPVCSGARDRWLLLSQRAIFWRLLKEAAGPVACRDALSECVGR